MSTLKCPNCGNETQSGYKFCMFCGENLEGIKTEKGSNFTLNKHPTRIDRNTFFCPKCMHENHIDNFNCSNCGEDFEKYDISRSVEEHTKKRAQQEELRRSIFWNLIFPCC